ncbi:SRPBCC family protein [Streptomyces sp. JV185]|uniref:SRPBCC family protein n=1 Tax=Streptomyces sp. JV185 TaxID=858638 RepID=UPI002E776823|nr:SRPBCC family protein [Streptomyces sp. JV185]MEE1770949.1 SRPBCC family protein [Streptomyces sp. JV185]
MPHVSANVQVSRPADEIFSFLRDPRNLAEWSSSIDRVIEGPIATELGDEYTCKFPGRRRAHRLRCTASTPVEYLAFRGAGMWTPLGRHSPELEFRLSPNREGTTVTVSVKPHLNGGMIILAPFVMMAWRRDLPTELGCLADLLSVEGGVEADTVDLGALPDGRDTRDAQDAGIGRDARGTKDARDATGTKDARDARDVRNAGGGLDGAPSMGRPG